MTEREADVSCSLVPRFDDPEDAARPVVLRVSVGLDIVLDMLPYPTAARSCVTRRAFADCLGRLDRQPANQAGILLEDLLIDEQSVPSILVVPSLAPARLGVDGFLGFDFFVQFERVEWLPRVGHIRMWFP